MGLDNGIILKSKNKVEFPSYVNIKDVTQWYPNKDNCYYYEVAYWRKCWNVRSAIMSIIGAEEPSEGEFDVTSHKCLDIAADLILMMTDPNCWDEDESIWSWEEIKDSLFQQVINLKWIATHSDEYNGYLYFYDSY